VTGRKTPNVQHPMSEFSSELCLASREMPEAENLDALRGFVHAIEILNDASRPSEFSTLISYL
jgi:hypothetical protein